MEIAEEYEYVCFLYAKLVVVRGEYPEGGSGHTVQGGRNISIIEFPYASNDALIRIHEFSMQVMVE